MTKDNESINRKDIVLFIILISLYIVSRLITIEKLPIFTDEAIYMRWAQISLHDASWRFISLTDGKQPMLIWLTMIVMKYLVNPLLSGRLVSAFAGLTGMLGAFFLGWEVFKKKSIGFLSAFFYLISPFFLWYDRLAIMDSLLAAFYIWSLYLEILLVRKLRLDIALILGLVIGGAVLTKTSGFFAIYLLPFMLLLFDFKKGMKGVLRFVVLSLVSVILAYGLYGILRLSPWFYIISQKDNSFIYSFSEIIANPFQYFFGNFRGLTIWWYSYFTLSFVFLLLVALINRDKKTVLERLLLFLLFILPFTALAFFGKVLYPRFILFMIVSLLPLLAYGLTVISNWLKNRQLKIILIVLAIIYPIYFDYQIVVNPVDAPLPMSDRKQYLDDWPSGFGVPEVIKYLKTEKEKQPIFVATEGTFGLFPYALELEFFSDPKIKINGYWPLPLEQKLINASEGRPAYLILKESQELPQGYMNTQLVNQYKRGKGDTYLKFYRINHSIN